MQELPSLSSYLQSLNEAAKVQIDLSKPLKLYLRSTELVFKQGAIYLAEGDLERTFILFMKFSSLVLDKLPKHPEYNKFEFDGQKSRLKEYCRKALNKLETIRPELERQYKEVLALSRSSVLEKALEEKGSEQRYLDELKELKAKPAQSQLKTSESHTLESAGSLSQAQNTLKTDSNPDVKPVYPQLSILPIVGGSSAIAPLNLDQKHVHEGGPTFFRGGKRYVTENGASLRPVHVPDCIVEKFLQVASSNTRRNLETCGVLAGKLHHDEFTITCMIIPKQVATSDTCAMINEEEIILAQDSLDVMSLGWIHTHPTQQCFLSSVDVHTHMPFQLLMAEAVAIVCAPTQNPNYGIFRLTDPPGLDLIAKCQNPSAFHPHPQNVSIYRELKGPTAHAQLNPNLPLEVIDLRSK